MIRCPSCTEENPDKFRVCGFCGTPLTGALAAAELRKTVTVLFSDLKGSTDLGEKLDPESLREVLNRYFAEMKAIIERHGGTVEKYIGDAIMAVFGIPRAHEDDALRAVRAAWDMRSALRALNTDLEARWGVALANRTGVHTGSVVTGDVTSGQRLVTGDTVNVAARLEQAAPELEVLIGAQTWKLTRDAVEAIAVEPLELKGKSERVPAFRLTGIRAGRPEGFTRRLDAPLVGRAEELGALRTTFDRTQAERRCRVVTVLGQAGLGKTRLVEELLHRVVPREALVMRGRCLPYGEGITFWPLAEIVRQATGIRQDQSPEEARARLSRLFPGKPEVVDRLAAVTGLSDETFGIRETFWAARKALEELSRKRPVVVVFEDIHWAEPTFLDLIEHVARTAEDAPALIICTSRGDLLEDRPRWLDQLDNASRVVLAALSAEETMLVADALLGRTGLPDRVRSAITAAADGVPLFVEQMISMLADDGALVPDESGGWTLVAEPASISVPPTISALLSARLDRLGREERAVIEAGSVPGPVFHRGAVVHLTPEALRPSVPEQLSGLEAKSLIASAPPTLVEDEAYRFQHILIRESAYEALLKRARAEMHERYVEWLERVAGPTTMDVEEIVGFHLERSYRYLAELGPVDERGRAIGARASEKLTVAGLRAFARGDMPAAGNLLQRAIDLAPPVSRARIEVASELAGALFELGRFADADAVLTAAITAASALGDRIRELDLRLHHLMVRRATDRAAWSPGAALQQARDAIPTFEAARDHRALARAWRIVTIIHGSANRNAEAEEAARHALAEEKRAGAPQGRTLNSLALIAVLGPLPVPQAILLCAQLREAASGDQLLQAMIGVLLAQLYAQKGDIEAARQTYVACRRTLDDLGAKVQAAASTLYSGRVELLAGRPDLAEALLRPAFRTLRGIGEKNYLMSIATVLAEALAAQQLDDEARDLTEFVERSAAPDDIDAQFRWRTVRARVLSHAGRHEDAIALAQEAVTLMRKTDALAKRGTALSALVEALRNAGRITEAIATAHEALSAYGAKGATTSFERTRAVLAGLEAAHLAATNGSPPSAPVPAVR